MIDFSLIVLILASVFDSYSSMEFQFYMCTIFCRLELSVGSIYLICHYNSFLSLVMIFNSCFVTLNFWNVMRVSFHLFSFPHPHCNYLTRYYSINSNLDLYFIKVIFHHRFNYLECFYYSAHYWDYYNVLDQ